MTCYDDNRHCCKILPRAWAGLLKWCLPADESPLSRKPPFSEESQYEEMPEQNRRQFLKSGVTLAASVALASALPRRGRAQAAPPGTPLRTGVYTVTERLDMAMVRRHGNFGYTDEEIQKYFDYPQVFEYDATGQAAGAIKAPPPPGVHPRVLFHPDDLPGLRRRLAETKPGKYIMDGIRAMLTRDLTGPNARFGALYQAAARGQQDPGLLDPECSAAINYECFRCLIDDDTDGGKMAAAALTTLAELDSAELDKAFALADSKPADPKAAIKRPLRDFQQTKGLTQDGLLPIGYDCAYGFMTADQRDTVRATLAKASANMTLLDAEGLPAFPANTSNWIPMHMRLVLLACSIEGEPGSDPGTYHRCVEGYKRYLNVGMFPAGDAYESMGKNFLFVDNLVPIADRGLNLPALKKVRAQVGGYYLHAMDPWGGHFTFYDSLGGRGNTTPMQDAQMMKYLFPQDPAIDFVYRNTVGEGYDVFKANVHFGHPLMKLVPLVQAIFAVEYTPQTWDEGLKAASAGKPLTFFSNGTGNLITRDLWDKDAVQLHFLTRSVSGGHQYADRTHFSLHALGRYWAIYKPLRQVDEHYLPKNRSVILIDGEGPGTTMAKCVALADEPGATFIAADAKAAYDWGSGGNERFPKGGEKVPFVGNDFHLEKVELPWMDAPWSDLPYWQTSMKGSELWLRRSPVARAFRTAGLVRGLHPYVLIVDDIQKDADAHMYEWGMVVEDDLVQQPPVADAPDDIVIAEAQPTAAGARFLLVRTLNVEGRDPANPSIIETYTLPNPPMKDITMHRLKITAHSVAPDFKTLLFPYRQGQEQPKTTWNADRTLLTVAWSDQSDVVSFTKGDDGRTRVKITRGGKAVTASESRPIVNLA